MPVHCGQPARATGALELWARKDFPQLAEDRGQLRASSSELLVVFGDRHRSRAPWPRAGTTATPFERRASDVATRPPSPAAAR